jgi:hypothetical protein
VGYWPTADEQGEYGQKLNKLTKFVASSKLDDSPWGEFPAATVTADRVAAVRAQAQGAERQGRHIHAGHQEGTRRSAPPRSTTAGYFCAPLLAKMSGT